VENRTQEKTGLILKNQEGFTTRDPRNGGNVKKFAVRRKAREEKFQFL